MLDALRDAEPVSRFPCGHDRRRDLCNQPFQFDLAVLPHARETFWQGRKQLDQKWSFGTGKPIAVSPMRWRWLTGMLDLHLNVMDSDPGAKAGFVLAP